MKLYMFRTARLSIISSLFTVYSAMVYVIQVCRQLSSRTRMVPSQSCSKAFYNPVRHIPLPSVHWINSWWWTDELSETCRISWQNKFVKLVYLNDFITKKFVTMHGRKDEVLQRLKEKRNIMHAIQWGDSMRIGHILCRNCILRNYNERQKGREREEEDVSCYLWKIKTTGIWNWTH